ncbi:hypothetical protein Q4566_11255 [Tamlana sp. 2_MG-2023]|uniref:hypothetical protein n=1 Tax=unclassified Tamlana TaxID=2614803 RepID=UPI0026E4735A|nr:MULTISPECIES: hypothetical protein [unclassified Tamlana]MDO6760779.1 hypothetical protein [Tamlana sp. 2_MG-2023]MDO6791035.1 hypothetical protein [Tamlana sp. 1_MG-2023]
MNPITSLLEKIQNGKSLDFGDIFGASIDLFKKTWLQGFILIILTLVVVIPLIIALYAPLIGLIMSQGQEGLVDDDAMLSFFGGMSLLYSLLVIIGFFVVGAVYFALNAGFYRIMRKLDANENTVIKDYFYFFKLSYLSKGMIITLISMLIGIVSLMLCYIPFIYAIVPLSFFAVIFAFNPELSATEIIKASFKLANKYWLVSFGLIVVSSILSQLVGYLACGIGLLFTASFIYHPIYLIYKNVIGFNEVNAIDEIGVSDY